MDITTTVAAVITAPRRVELQEVDLPPLTTGHVLVEVAENGICASDLQVYDGKDPKRFPMYVGHEFGGRVVEAGPGVTSLAVGDRVAVWTPGGKVPGTFGLANHAVAQAANCVKTTILNVAAVEPLACCVNAVDLARPQQGDHVVVIGGGYMAQLIVALLAMRERGTGSITVAARRPYQLDYARRMGATNVVHLDGRDWDANARLLAEGVRRHTGVAHPDVAYETTGAADGVNYAARLLDDCGVLVDVGYGQGGPQELNRGEIETKGLVVVIAHFRPNKRTGVNRNVTGFRKAIGLLEAGHLAAVAELVTDRASLAEVVEAFAYADGRFDQHLKTVFTFDPSLGT